MKKLLTLNIEGDTHLGKVRPFLAEENPDIICLEEVFREDVQDLVGSEYAVEFLPMCLKVREDATVGQWGIAIATRLPFFKVIREYYHQPNTTIVMANGATIDTMHATYRQGVLGIAIADAEDELLVFVTHFTWSQKGLSNHYQENDMRALLTFMYEQGPHIICGDFNIPRKQNSVYPMLTAHYTDHVPAHYVTSMHIPLHRTKDDPVESKRVGSFMVDYILSTPKSYAVTDVLMHCGMSDHCALTAHIEKLP